MAKIHEELIVFKLSKLVRETDETKKIATDELKNIVESQLAECVDKGLIIEVVDLTDLGL